MKRELRDFLRRALRGRAFAAAVAAETPKVWRHPELALAYVHVPKAATRSIRSALTRHVRPESGAWNAQAMDAAADEYSNFVPHAEIAGLARLAPDIFRFSFVRDPFDRLFSCYNDKVIGPAKDPSRSNIFWAHGIRPGIPFERFVERVAALPDVKADRHLRSQSWFLYDGDEPLIDFVGRFENLDEDWQRIRSRFDLPAIPHENRSVRRAAFQEAYTPRLAQLVARRYARDLELFGYEDSARELG